MTLSSLLTPRVSRARRGARAAVVLLGSLTLAHEPTRALPSPAQTAGPIVAIGDVHGEAAGLEAILKRTGLVDERLAWRGGRATLVVLGDFTDRGPGVRRVLDLLMQLEVQAPASGGRVVVLLGNHEVMNLVGETRDVTPEIFASFADERSETRRVAAYEAYAALARPRGAARATGIARQGREEWMAAHPPGFLEYREALGPNGRYGRWLRGHPIAARIEGAILMHAGVSPDAAPRDLEDLNRRARDEIQRFDRYVARLVDRGLALPFFTLQEILAVSAAEVGAAQAIVAGAHAEGKEPDLSGFDLGLLAEAREILQIGTWSLLDPEGPLWFRGYATWPDEGAPATRIGALLDRYRARVLVLGHTPSADGRIRRRFGGRVFLIDTGMLASHYPRGRPAALEIEGASVTAVYLDDRVPLVRPHALSVHGQLDPYAPPARSPRSASGRGRRSPAGPGTARCGRSRRRSSRTARPRGDRTFSGPRPRSRS